MTDLRYDDQGLIVSIAQHHLTGQVLMVAWMNAEALAKTLETGRATFFSRSRGRLWEKGETSGNRLTVRSVGVDCDGDTLLLLVDPAGPACHTGAPTCFFRTLNDQGEIRDRDAPPDAFLFFLEREIERRAGSTAERSYTRHLLDGGAEKIGAKLREEANELAVALASETNERVANEAADVIYHLIVGLRLRGIPLTSVIEVLSGRSGTSGHDEKAARGPQAS